MNENQAKQDNLLDTTDCLEAVGVFRGWKNFLFITVACCLLLLQIVFWVVDLEFVKVESKKSPPPKAASPDTTNKDAGPVKDISAVTIVLAEDINEIQQAAKEVVADSNLPAAAEPQKTGLLPALKFKHLAWLIRFLDFVLIITATLYCLTMLFSLVISLLGRLGGINHISRAFFLSLVFLVLILPWQKLFGPVVKGAIFTPGELTAWLKWCSAETTGTFAVILYYLRFTGYWVLVILLLIFSLLRSSHWAKATLRRLEII